MKWHSCQDGSHATTHGNLNMSDVMTRVAELRATDEPGPAKRRRNAQRRRIFAAAVELYEENGGEAGGLEKTTAEAIAERSDISVRTFFRYFESKTDAIYVDLPAAMDDHLALTKLLLVDLPPAEAVLAASTIQLTDAINDPDDVARLLRSMRSKHFAERSAVFRARLCNELAQMIEPFLPEQPHRSMAARAIATSSLDLRDSALTAWAVSRGEADLIELFDEAIAVWKDIWANEVPGNVDASYDRSHHGE